MNLILGLETSSKFCSVALFDSSRLIISKKDDTPFKHSQVIFPMIQSLFEECSYKIQDIKCVALSSGSGSFTGLRIGGAAAMGICHSLEIPFIAISTLESLISHAIDICPNTSEDTLFCPVIDARRMEVYCMITNREGKIVMDQQAKIIDKHSFEDINNEIIIFGDGAEKCKNILRYKQNIKFLDDIDTAAEYLCKIACQRYEKKDFNDILTFSPNYIK